MKTNSNHIHTHIQHAIQTVGNVLKTDAMKVFLKDFTVSYAKNRRQRFIRRKALRQRCGT